MREKINIKLIEVSKKDPTITVKVTDQKGNPIIGLRKEDFIISNGSIMLVDENDSKK